MKIGCCGSMIDPKGDPIGIEALDVLAEAGYDYIELSLRDLAVLDENEYAKLRARVLSSPLRCESCNNMLPSHLKVTGEDPKQEEALDFLHGAFARAQELGAKAIVFGSPLSKNVQPGFDHAAARQQLLHFVRKLGDVAAQYGLTIGMEPINAGESNLLVSAEETCEFVKEADHPNIQLLVDYYHLSLDGEDPAVVLKSGEYIRHIHFSGVHPRVFPKTREEDPGYEVFIENLAKVGYKGRVSIEAYTQDFAADAEASLAMMRQLIAQKQAEAAKEI
ncbi:MAG: sugar phosphate isomerase/epimerase [Christensenellaceae bacterium]|nr:sugar phosphate isomerase/epimerase [Christensenellaceae bacterium]